MKLLTFKKDNKEQLGALDESKGIIFNVSEAAMKDYPYLPTSMLAAIEKGNEFIMDIKSLMASEDLNHFYENTDTIEVLSPITKPQKNILCVGKNYRDHAIEMGSEADIPKDIIIFTKAPTTVTGHLNVIESHSEITNQLDYEGELAIIIGKRGRSISKNEALDYVFGYTIINDVTARDIQKRHNQYFLGKSLDSSCPMGPWIVHRSAIENPNQLNIVTKVNDEIRQNSNTKHFIFSVEEIISTLSKGMTLEPGDIIATGTPAGVGNGMKPPKFLAPGDKIEITVEGIGTLTNMVK
ncbi:fumarylacetoacetate hydrolase family protein [Bacillus sp. FJAT-49736]|uniref:fumarylacetoacetate hydrolase family protein n=1 Tax=Bacillus sp. FJAT-49736 TaxID=2833582 RepID=UPI001BC99D17|nr:fumarylacetoacetate hydrolase family protein [Bacillus sp. FJAT-49736]MBS4172015.1 fumarylacetoacetate hydrolase family protein [Bacillus sp. FJAT-49736]